VSLQTITRFLSHVNKTETCWLWTAAKSKRGYGLFKYQGRMVIAARFSYEAFVGPIPEGFTIDHVFPRCKSKACVRPDHLEPVTSGENTRRYHAQFDECYQGHEYNEKNTLIDSNGHRKCRECRRLRVRAWRSRKKLANVSRGAQ